MINIVAGYFENRNILEASKEASSIEDLNVSIANSEQELINAFKDPGVDAVVWRRCSCQRLPEIP